LIVAAHFILASFVILFFATYVILYLPKGKVEPELLNALKEVLEYDFYIILSGLGFVTSEGIVSIIVSKFTKNNNQQLPIDPYDPNQVP
jgi:ABC-type transport system involved in multi-copper enzyme maturation permease subunit